jgi:Cu/Ag efflux pump CusA
MGLRNLLLTELICSTGIRTDVGIKIYGASLDTINVLSQKKKALEGTEGGKICGTYY